MFRGDEHETVAALVRAHDVVCDSYSREKVHEDGVEAAGSTRAPREMLALMKVDGSWQVKEGVGGTFEVDLLRLHWEFPFASDEVLQPNKCETGAGALKTNVSSTVVHEGYLKAYRSIRPQSHNEQQWLQRRKNPRVERKLSLEKARNLARESE
ncbi:hypothetical protein GALMADRAFT_1349839 [Galerina marginata CBS 339.88]|uniref:Uncharacterized protein n=1 Tax=Galerina marginata (strain CBS 339.88) TaxID=685588 RepID=A0A067SKU2_GALM3|nr:hypothetical protein GALMADRAFT_1349839 [Galerina marginata CBS 339.88]